jgi:hypothetical protein
MQNRALRNDRWQKETERWAGGGKSLVGEVATTEDLTGQERKWRVEAEDGGINELTSPTENPQSKVQAWVAGDADEIVEDSFPAHSRRLSEDHQR